MYYKEELLRIRNKLAERKADLEGELRDLPEGMLAVTVRNGKYFYMQRFPKSGNRKKEHRRGITRDKDTILALVRKRYVVSAIEALAEDIEAISTALEAYKPADELSLMKEYLDKYPMLESGLTYDGFDPAVWADAYVEEEAAFAEGLKSVSAEGRKRRSVAELYIESRLQHFGIPYRYEADLGIPDLSYIPDFTVIRPRDGKVFYWEHIGMVADEANINRNMRKIESYVRYGITPWDNLILTYNMKDGGLNAKLIDSMIECWLL